MRDVEVTVRVIVVRDAPGAGCEVECLHSLDSIGGVGFQDSIYRRFVFIASVLQIEERKRGVLVEILCPEIRIVAMDFLYSFLLNRESKGVVAQVIDINEVVGMMALEHVIAKHGHALEGCLPTGHLKRFLYPDVVVGQCVEIEKNGFLLISSYGVGSVSPYL